MVFAGRDPSMSDTKESEQFERGIAHFNSGEFFQAHEVWEELWLRATGTEKPFLRGIIQVAAAFHHFKRRNVTGAKSLLAAGLAKLSKYADKHRGIDVFCLREDIERWLVILQSAETLRDPKFPRIHEVNRPATEP